jgi:N-acyl-D-amino-acid deacylase
MPDYNLLIKNGRLVDGTGNPWFKADIGISEGKIEKIGSIKEKEEQTIDVEGLIVSPGFIDLHNHSDLTVLAYPHCENYLMQGVTTAVVGNCGLSMAPLNPKRMELLKTYLSPLLAPDFDYRWNWRTLGEFYKIVKEKGTGMNLVPLVGQGTIRVAVKGFEKSEASAQEMKEMKRLLAQSLEEGAFGMSTGLIYPPGSYTPTKELIELGRILKEYGRIYASHIRNEADFLMEALKEVIKIGEVNGIPVEISHHKASGESNWGKVNATLRAIREARERGVEVGCDVYPYTAGSTTITAILPGWALEGGVERMLDRLKKKEARKKIKEELSKDTIKGENWIKEAGFDGIIVASCQSNREYEGKSLEEILREKGRLQEKYEGLLDLLLEIGGNASIVLFTMSEEDVKTVISSPISSIASDSWVTSPSIGKPHPRAYGTFPRVLGKYVREERILTLEDAIRKMSSLPASKVRLKNRGLLKEEFWADLVVFDPAKIRDRSTYKDPHQYPIGIKYVIVNGQIAVENGKLTDSKPGKIIKSSERN